MHKGHKEKISDMNKYEFEPRGKPPKNLRMTGRDGPPGSQMKIHGAPVWLAIGTPAQFMSGDLESHGICPINRLVIPTKYEEGSNQTEKFLCPSSLGMIGKKVLFSSGKIA